ncbi:MAG: nucleoside hydrolase [Pelolinea sp.]|nr:nucleoside hydrolase [Pelolinea sp.]
MARNVIIDCDTGLDDAVALLLALRSSELNVLGITCVNGNVGLDKVVYNTLRVVEQSGKQVPVYAGATSALMVDADENASKVHGSDGLGGIPLPAPKHSVENEHAIDFIVRTFMEAKEPMDWITIGPLTNAALALRKEPRIEEKIRLLTMMAGGLDSGNTRPMAEFNVFADPDAARIVFDSAMPKMMVPLDPLFLGGYLKWSDQQKIKAASDKLWCNLAGKIFDVTHELVHKMGRKQVTEEGAVSPPDLLAVAAAIDPSIMEIENYQIHVETRGEFTRGMTVVDRRKYQRGEAYPGRKEVAVVIDADQQKYASLVLNTWLA